VAVDLTILTTTAHDVATEPETGRIKLQLDGAVAGTATFTCCPACRTATLGYVHVVARYRRLGYGRTLAAAARERVPDYRWSAPLPDGVVAQAFRSRIPYLPGEPPCVHRQPDTNAR
jgi:GNAT superfamily N-acetyltransferase